ncbi:50S ribosomal protein L22 [Patescibacteria group bacterium]|nr:50S ribosomal protein L22 [Patescibacteria group bacterium]
MKAELTSHNQSPRKVRLVTDLVKGKRVSDALAALSFLPKRASLPIAKLIQSAAANAKNLGEDVDTLRIQNIMVDSAGMVVRMMPRAMGRGAPIRHRKSRVKVILVSDAPKTAPVVVEAAPEIVRPARIAAEKKPVAKKTPGTTAKKAPAKKVPAKVAA